MTTNPDIRVQKVDLLIKESKASLTIEKTKDRLKNAQILLYKITKGKLGSNLDYYNEA